MRNMYGVSKQYFVTSSFWGRFDDLLYSGSCEIRPFQSVPCSAGVDRLYCKRKSLISRHEHVKYQNANSNSSKVIAKIKVVRHVGQRSGSLSLGQKFSYEQKGPVTRNLLLKYMKALLQLFKSYKKVKDFKYGQCRSEVKVARSKKVPWKLLKQFDPFGM